MIVAFCSLCLVADYSQNLGLPHFGTEQPGDIYYFSPLSVFIFGITDVSCTPEVLHACGYTEDQGLKGGNNVASLIMHTLQHLGWLRGGGKKLSIVMDNCAGQNKNNSVLRLALLLVELQFFKTVEFIFYVRGHTKNVCDRMFNLLKKRFTPAQVYSVDQLILLLNAEHNVNYNQVTSDVFYNYSTLLSMFYKNMEAGTVKKYHQFWVEDSNCCVMYRREYADTDDMHYPVESTDHFKPLNAIANNVDRYVFLLFLFYFTTYFQLFSYYFCLGGISCNWRTRIFPS